MCLLTRCDFLNHCPMKPLVISQSLSKLDMFTLMFYIYVFHNISFVNGGGNQSFGFLVGEHKNEQLSKDGWGEGEGGQN